MKLSTYLCCLLLSTSTILLADNDQNNVALEDVIITGDKIERNLQDTISSIQVFGETEFNNSSNLNDMFDLFTQTSNVNVNGQSVFNIRGISTTGIAGKYIGPRMTNIEVDGSSLGSNATRKGSVSTWDMQQVEVLKGPQSTTQGRNSLAGALIMKTKDPEFETNGAIQVDYGTDTKQLSLMQTGPINDNLALRISMDKRNTDGFVTNDTFRGDEFNKQDNLNVRGKLLYDFNSDTNVLLTLSKMNQDQDGYWLVDKNKVSVNNTDGHYYTDAYAHSLEINHNLNNKWSFKSISSFTDEKIDILRDFDQQAGDATITFDRKNDAIDQEFRFSYIGENSKSVIGLYHSEGKGTDERFIENQKFSGATIEVDMDLKEEYSNNAIFFNTDYYIKDNITLITGLRIDKDERENSSSILATRTVDSGNPAFNAAIDSALAGLSNNATAKNNSINIIPKLGINFKVNQNINTGILLSQGYRPGGMSTNPITGKSSEYDKEYTNNIELSFKSKWLDDRITFNTNVFYTQWKNQQVEEEGSSTPYDTNVVNAGTSTLKGIEFDLKAQVTNQIDIYSNVGYVKAEFGEYVNSTDNYSGNTLPKTPKITANIGTNYRYNRYFIGGNITYTGAQYSDTANKNKLDSYSLVNMKVGYEHNDWSLYVYANNLLNKSYAVSDFGTGVYEMGDERIAGINFKYYW